VNDPGIPGIGLPRFGSWVPGIGCGEGQDDAGDSDNGDDDDDDEEEEE
jgi:hypothetical protein